MIVRSFNDTKFSNDIGLYEITDRRNFDKPVWKKPRTGKFLGNNGK